MSGYVGNYVMAPTPRQTYDVGLVVKDSGLPFCKLTVRFEDGTEVIADYDDVEFQMEGP